MHEMKSMAQFENGPHNTEEKSTGVRPWTERWR